MADDTSRKFEIPWATLLPLLAMLGGLVAQYRPLTSARPPVPAEKSIAVAASQDVDARLWQDPLAVATKSWESLQELEKQSGSGTAKVDPATQSEIERHSFPALTRKIDEITKSKKSLLVLAVMLNSGPYAEQGELRLRAREAVLEGLSESGYVPTDGEHIGFVTAEWPPPGAPQPSGESTLLIPWEECDADPPDADFDHVLVLWLPSSNFSFAPLHNLAGLIDELKLDPTGATFKIIGPPTSSGLQAMLKETVSAKQGDPALPELKALDGVTMLCAKATAPVKDLLGDKAEEKDIPERLQTLVPKDRGGLTFYRTNIPDDRLGDLLVSELTKEHGINLPLAKSADPGTDPKLPPGSPADPKLTPVIVLTEWDSKYGRALGDMFRKWDGVTIFHYLHGIDGRLPGDPTKPDASNDQAKTASASATTEATEGQDQSDFLRRLARELKNEDRISERKRHRHIRAIGLLGTDVFDKLMILRALRPEFPDAVFFTNNYDAHLELREVWQDTHNLIVASPFGSVFPGYQEDLAPFRDSDQTSMFASTLVATGCIPIETLQQPNLQPYLFEVGRNGMQQLATPYEGQADTLPTSPRLDWFMQWLGHWRTILALGLSAVFFASLVFWVSRLAIRRRPEEDSRQRLVRILSHKALVIAGIPVIVFTVCWLAQSVHPIEEPLAFFSGISIWPSEILRLSGVLLGLHFMFRTRVALRDNEEEINKTYGLGFAERIKGVVERPDPQPGKVAPSARRLWQPGWKSRLLRKVQTFSFGLAKLQKDHPKSFTESGQFPALKIWRIYLLLSRFWPRLLRVAIYVTIYLLFVASLFALCGVPLVPARGVFAQRFDHSVLLAGVLTMMILTFYIVDAIQLTRNFILIFARGIASWPAISYTPYGRIPPLDATDLVPYHDIHFVAKRTEVIAPLIWYPLIILTIMVVARFSIFDDWSWPPMLVLIFGLNILWALGSALLLRRAAERLRATAVEKLRALRATNYNAEPKRAALTELIDEIRDLKTGAFAPLGEQPFIRAVLVPSGGIGLFAIAQRLFDLF